MARQAGPGAGGGSGSSLALMRGLGNAATFAVLLVALWVLMSARSACELKQGAGSSGSSVAGGRAEGSLRIWRGFGSSSGTSSSEAAANLLKPAPPPGAAAAATAALPAAAASSPALVDLSLAHRLLPLTNLSSLTTAALLDAHPGLSPAEARELVRLQQELHCRAVAGQPDPPGTRRIPFGNVTLFVYAAGDIVSGSLDRAHAWELGETHEMLWALRAPVPPPGASAESAGRHLWRRAAAPLAVDVGANVGWFALNAAAAGARVAAFEAMASNAALLRASLCANPWLMARTALYATGLGARRERCHIISAKSNRGDGHTVCGEDPRAYLRRSDPAGDYEVRGEISVARLDALVAEDVQFAKLDVEGFELDVLKGAERLLRDHRVWHVMAEFNGGILGPRRARAYLRFLVDSGYAVSLTSFKGPFLDGARLAAGHLDPPLIASGGDGDGGGGGGGSSGCGSGASKAVEAPTLMLYCVRRELVDGDGGARR